MELFKTTCEWELMVVSPDMGRAYVAIRTVNKQAVNKHDSFASYMSLST